MPTLKEMARPSDIIRNLREVRSELDKLIREANNLEIDELSKRVDMLAEVLKLAMDKDFNSKYRRSKNVLDRSSAIIAGLRRRAGLGE